MARSEKILAKGCEVSRGFCAVSNLNVTVCPGTLTFGVLNRSDQAPRLGQRKSLPADWLLFLVIVAILITGSVAFTVAYVLLAITP